MLCTGQGAARPAPAKSDPFRRPGSSRGPASPAPLADRCGPLPTLTSVHAHHSPGVICSLTPRGLRTLASSYPEAHLLGSLSRSAVTHQFTVHVHMCATHVNVAAGTHVPDPSSYQPDYGNNWFMEPGWEKRNTPALTSQRPDGFIPRPGGRSHPLKKSSETGAPQRCRPHPCWGPLSCCPSWKLLDRAAVSSLAWSSVFVPPPHPPNCSALQALQTPSWAPVPSEPQNTQ